MTKYIKNTSSYDMILKIKDKIGDEQEYGFPCFRRYSDTGNVYTSGVTALDEGDVALLKENKQFNKLLSTGEFQWTTKEAFTESANELESAKAENEVLKAENEELRKAAAEASSDELKKALAENEELKKKLETLGKAGKDPVGFKAPKKENKKDTGDTGGF